MHSIQQACMHTAPQPPALSHHIRAAGTCARSGAYITGCTLDTSTRQHARLGLLQLYGCGPATLRAWQLSCAQGESWHCMPTYSPPAAVHACASRQQEMRVQMWASCLCILAESNRRCPKLLCHCLTAASALIRPAVLPPLQRHRDKLSLARQALPQQAHDHVSGTARLPDAWCGGTQPAASSRGRFKQLASGCSNSGNSSQSRLHGGPDRTLYRIWP